MKWPTKEKAQQIADDFNSEYNPEVFYKVVEVPEAYDELEDIFHPTPSNEWRPRRGRPRKLMEPKIMESQNRQQNQNDDSKRSASVRPSSVRNKGTYRAENKQHPKEDL